MKIDLDKAVFVFQLECGDYVLYSSSPTSDLIENLKLRDIRCLL